MKKERKEALMYAFPPVPDMIMEQMKGRGATNFCVFLANGRELFVRGFHRYSHGELLERQRYVFAKDGCVRYTYDEWYNQWRIASKFREPYFASIHAMGPIDSSYCILNAKAIENSDLRYCPIDDYCYFPMQFMRLYIRHPNIEYLYKAGFGHLLHMEDYNVYGEFVGRVYVDDCVDLKSNNLLKMLGIRSKSDIEICKRMDPKQLKLYKELSEKYPHMAEFALMIPPSECNDFLMIYRMVTLSPVQIRNYIQKQGCRSSYWLDCLNMAKEIYGEDFDSRPKDLIAAHDRCVDIQNAKKQEDLRLFSEARNKKLEAFVWQEDGLMIVLPQSVDDIVAEGKALAHCVGGYAERHFKGQTTILFLRKTEEPDKPFYTMEINKTGKIQQCYGYRNNTANNPKPPEIKAFERHYEQYLQEVIHDKRNHRAARQSA